MYFMCFCIYFIKGAPLLNIEQLLILNIEQGWNKYLYLFHACSILTQNFV